MLMDLHKVVCCAGRRVTVALLTVCVSGSGAFGQADDGFKARPGWNVAEASERLIVEKAQDDFFLVKVPARVGDQGTAAVRVFITTNEVASRVVWADESHVTVLIDAREAKRGQPVRIYPVPGEKAVAAEPSAAGADPAPLRGCARRTAGMDFPKSLADVMMLETRCDGKPVWFTAAGMGQLPGTFTNWFRGDWTRKSHLVDLQTWLVIPADGNYLFGLAGVAPAWLLVDGRPVMAHPPGQVYDKWTSGDEVPLKAGLRRVQVRTVVRQEIDTGLAWKRSGEPGTATNMVMLTGGDLREGRREVRDRRLHPFATAASGEAYRFTGVDEIFVPFTLKDGTACWGTNHVVRWSAGARGDIGAGETVTAVMRKSELPARVTVRAVAATGEEAAYETAVDYDGPVWSEAEITTRVAGVPAVCYGDDRVNPIIRVRTSAPDGLAYELAWGVERGSGGRAERVDALATDKGWARVYLDEFEAGEVSRLTWSLRHHGVEISKGAMRFLKEPFEVLPDAVSGETLKAGDEFVVLVVSRASRGDLVAAAGEGSNGVVLVDGFLKLGMRNEELGVEGEEPWRVVDMQAVEQDEAASGIPLLLPLAALGEAMPASVAVLAPSLQGISREGGAGGFERRLSAMTGLLTGAASGKPRVVLVVPPAFDVLPGCGCVPGAVPCVHAAEARTYAETVMRVADTHGVETVNLFTVFQTAGSDVPLVAEGRLTAAGTAFAETLIRKKLAK